MQICTLLTRSQCKISDTQVTVKACGPLVFDEIKNKICIFAFFDPIQLFRNKCNFTLIQFALHKLHIIYNSITSFRRYFSEKQS